MCYSRTDSAIARQLRDKLEAEGWTVYLDVQTQVGRRWDQEIVYQLAAAKSVVTLWSAQSRTSEYVLEEAECGKRNNKLFPALIERVDFHMALAASKRLIWLDGKASQTIPAWLNYWLH